MEGALGASPSYQSRDGAHPCPHPRFDWAPPSPRLLWQPGAASRMGTLSTHMGHRSRGIGHSEYSHRVLGVLTSGTRSTHTAHRCGCLTAAVAGPVSHVPSVVAAYQQVSHRGTFRGALTLDKYSECSHRALGVLTSGYSLPNMIW